MSGGSVVTGEIWSLTLDGVTHSAIVGTTTLANGTAIYGKAPDDSAGVGVRGDALSANSAGVYGFNRDSAAVWGKSIGNGAGIYGENTGGGFAGRGRLAAGCPGDSGHVPADEFAHRVGTISIRAGRSHLAVF